MALKYKIAPLKKIIKIYNGINPVDLNFLEKQEARKILGVSPALGNIANFYKTKGLGYLIEAMYILQQQGKDIGLVIIGDGPERKSLEKQIAKYNLEKNVFLLGKKTKASRYLKAFDIFVLPSVKEGFPFVILEAMSAEIPIIATTVGAIPEILENEKSGILVPPKNSKALVGAIIELLDSPQKQKNLAENAKQKLANFSLSQTLSQTYSLY